MLSRPLLFSALVSFSLVLGCGAPSATGARDPKVAASGVPDRAKVITHLSSKVKFPATKDQVLETFEDTPDFSDDELKYIKSTLAPGNYAAPEDVAKALGLQAAPPQK